MVNRVMLIGNLTRDAEAIAARSPMTRMRLATNSVWRDADGNRQEAPEYHTVITFGRLAEVCATYCTKGKRIYVEGRLRTRDYEGADGQRKWTTEVIAETMKLLDRADHAADHAADRDPDDAATPEPLGSRLAATAAL